MSVFSHSAGGIVLNPRGEVLLVLQRNGCWSFPKGGIQEGEDPSVAALREIAEESGLRSVFIRSILQSYTRYTLAETGMEDRRKLKRITLYVCTTTELELCPMDPRIAEAKWFLVEEAVTLLAHPKDQEVLRDAIPALRLHAVVNGTV